MLQLLDDEPLGAALSRVNTPSSSPGAALGRVAASIHLNGLLSAGKNSNNRTSGVKLLRRADCPARELGHRSYCHAVAVVRANHHSMPEQIDQLGHGSDAITLINATTDRLTLRHDQIDFFSNILDSTSN